MKTKSINAWAGTALPWLPLLGTWLVSVFFCWEFLQQLPFYLPNDDAYIVLSYARNIVEHGEFFAYNHGTPSTGITSPLYAIVLAAGKLLLGDWNGSIRLVGFVSFVGGLAVGSAWVFQLAGRGWQGRLAAALFSLSWGCWGYVHFFAFLGMEPILFIALALSSVLLFQRGRVFPAGLLLGLAALCRPEAVFMGLLYGLLPACRLVRSVVRKDRPAVKAAFVEGLLLGAGFMLAYGPWMIECLVVNGSVFPLTVSTKTASAIDWNGVRQYLYVFFHWFDPNHWFYTIPEAQLPRTGWIAFRSAFPVGVVPLAVLVFLWRRPRDFLPVLFPAVHFLLTFSRNWSAGENMRYLPFDFTVGLACFSVLAARCIGLPFSVRRDASRRKILRWVASATACAASFLLVFATIADRRFHEIHFQIMSNYFHFLDYSIGEWLAKNTPPGTTVALYQAGGIKFFGNRTVIDGGAVTDHTMLPYRQGKKSMAVAIVERDADYVAPFGDDWLASAGLHMRDPRFFTLVNLRCRGLYKVNKPALREYVRSRWPLENE